MDSEHAQLQHWGRQSKDSPQQTLQLVSSDHVTKAGSEKKTTILKQSSDTDRLFAAKMMCVLNITSDVGKIFFWN